MDDRIRTVVMVLPKLEVPMPQFLHGPGGLVADSSPPVPSRDWPGGKVGEHLVSGRPPTLSFILPKYGKVGVVPYICMQGPGNKPHQPPD